MDKTRTELAGESDLHEKKVSGPKISLTQEHQVCGTRNSPALPQNPFHRSESPQFSNGIMPREEKEVNRKKEAKSWSFLLKSNLHHDTREPVIPHDPHRTRGEE
jgi:hypothetical protein